MFNQELINQLKADITAANSFLLLLPPQPDTDSLAAALSLHLILKQAGKISLVGCSTDVKVSDAYLFGVADVKKSIGRQNLIISFPYREEAVENVSYDIDESNGKFNLRIRPRQGHDPLDPQAVDYTYSGASADLVITFAINTLEELGKLYSEEKEFLDRAKIINLVAKPQNVQFAATVLTPQQPTTLTQVVAHLAEKLGLEFTPDAATNLFQQLSQNTQNYQSNTVTPETFETAAALLRAGARRQPAASVSRPSFPKSDKGPSSAQPPKSQELPPPRIFRGGEASK